MTDNIQSRAYNFLTALVNEHLIEGKEYTDIIPLLHALSALGAEEQVLYFEEKGEFPESRADRLRLYIAGWVHEGSLYSDEENLYGKDADEKIGALMRELNGLPTYQTAQAVLKFGGIGGN